jgi:methionyl-tRNA synthetase
VLYCIAEVTRIGAILASPFLPQKSSITLDLLGVDPDKRTLEYAGWSRDTTYGKIPEKIHLVFQPA